MGFKIREGLIVVQSHGETNITYDDLFNEIPEHIRNSPKDLIGELVTTVGKENKQVVKDFVHDLSTSNNTIFIGKNWENFEILKKIIEHILYDMI